MPIAPLLPAAMLVTLLAPAVALQSVGEPWQVFVAWLLGSATGSYAGVAGGIRLRARMGLS
jgi:hypothetical protein